MGRLAPVWIVLPLLPAVFGAGCDCYWDGEGIACHGSEGGERRPTRGRAGDIVDFLASRDSPGAPQVTDWGQLCVLEPSGVACSDGLELEGEFAAYVRFDAARSEDSDLCALQPGTGMVSCLRYWEPIARPGASTIVGASADREPVLCALGGDAVECEASSGGSWTVPGVFEHVVATQNGVCALAAGRVDCAAHGTAAPVVPPLDDLQGEIVQVQGAGTSACALSQAGDLVCWGPSGLEGLRYSDVAAFGLGDGLCLVGPGYDGVDCLAEEAPVLRGDDLPFEVDRVLTAQDWVGLRSPSGDLHVVPR